MGLILVLLLVLIVLDIILGALILYALSTLDIVRLHQRISSTQAENMLPPDRSASPTNAELEALLANNEERQIPVGILPNGTIGSVLPNGEITAEQPERRPIPRDLFERSLAALTVHEIMRPERSPTRHVLFESTRELPSSGLIQQSSREIMRGFEIRPQAPGSLARRDTPEFLERGTLELPLWAATVATDPPAKPEPEPETPPRTLWERLTDKDPDDP